MNHAPAAIPSLTSIRGIAALIVLFFHIHQTFPDQSLEFFRLFRNGDFGVDLFFVLSGFIMAYVYTETSPTIEVRRFWLDFIKARLARIYPLHLATLAAALALVIALPGFAERYPSYFSSESFVLNLLLIQNWGWIGISWNTVSWSISAEWFMYLLFPFMLRAQQRWWPRSNERSMIWAILPILCVLSLHYSIILARGWSNYGGMSLGGMVRVICEFTLGFFIFLARDRLHPEAKTLRFECYSYALCVTFVLVFLYEEFWFLFVPVSALLIATLSVDQGTLARLLSWRPLIALGEISFSLYMWHWLIIQMHNLWRDQGYLSIDGRGELYLHCMSMVTLSLLVATASFYWIEKPARRWINQGFSGRQDRSQNVPGEQTPR